MKLEDFQETSASVREGLVSAEELCLRGPFGMLFRAGASAEFKLHHNGDG